MHFPSELPQADVLLELLRCPAPPRPAPKGAAGDDGLSLHTHFTALRGTVRGPVMSYYSTARSTSINSTQLGPVPQRTCTIQQRRPSSGYRVGPSSPQYKWSQEVSAVQREAMISTHIDLTRKVGAALELTLASRTVLCSPVEHCPW